MIQSFGDRVTEQVFHGERHAPRLPRDLLPAAVRKLDMLNAAVGLADLTAPPGNRLEALKGSLKGFHSIRINRQWRIVFRWTASGPAEVRIVDYH